MAGYLMPASTESNPGGHTGAQEGQRPGGQAATKTAQSATKRAHRQVRTEKEQHKQTLLRKSYFVN